MAANYVNRGHAQSEPDRPAFANSWHARIPYAPFRYSDSSSALSPPPPPQKGTADLGKTPSIGQGAAKEPPKTEKGHGNEIQVPEERTEREEGKKTG